MKKEKKVKTGKKGMGLLGKMILSIVPVVFIAINVVAFISADVAGTSIRNMTDNYLKSELQANVNQIDGELDQIRVTAKNLSTLVGASYHSMKIRQYSDIFKSTVASNELILGAGIWFEPKAFDGDGGYVGKEYVGPYWYIENGAVTETWMYSGADYDYFSQEYYINAKKMAKGEAQITDPYYDPSSGIVMATCSAPIYDANDTFIGCVTVDITLGTISESVANITVGREGYAMTTENGVYLYCRDEAKVSDGVNIEDDEDDMGAIAADIVYNVSGTTSYKEAGKAMTVIFDSIPEVNWKLALVMPTSEVNEASNKITAITLPLVLISTIVSAVVIYIISKSIAKAVLKVKEFAGELATGNFTVDNLTVTRKDELGQMSDSLNEMYASNKEIITNISHESEIVTDAASTLSAMSEELSAEFVHISENMAGVNELMMDSSAATEEVSASVTEINSAVQRVAEETNAIADKVKVITERALGVQKDSEKAYESAIQIAKERERELDEARAKAEVVKEIEGLTNVINNIASEIDLLSLNASIEAARAGEAGRGFAVVAQQINKLATETAEAVSQIQGTISGIQGAFADLGNSSSKLLEFVTETATPDYDKFAKIGKQYGDDAKQFGQLSSDISGMIENIKLTMEEVNIAVQNIASSTENTAARSSSVTDSVNSANQAIESIAEQATNQQNTAATLADIVHRFKL